MDLTAFFNSFVDDPNVRILVGLVALDFILGISAALVNPTMGFRLSFIGDIFRNDVLGKLIPYLGIWVVLHSSGVDFSVAGIDAIEETTFAIAALALGGSILSSLNDMGLWKSGPPQILGPDPETPTVPAPPNP